MYFKMSKCAFILILSVAVLFISCGSYDVSVQQIKSTSIAESDMSNNIKDSMEPNNRIETVQDKHARGIIKLSDVSFVSSVIDDKKKENISLSEVYRAFESIINNDLIYIEDGEGYEETCAVPQLDGTRILLVEDGRNNLPWVIDETEKAFPGKTLKYHVTFDSVYEGDYHVDNYGFVKQEELVSFRNESMMKICEMFSCDIQYKTTDFGELVCSPEVYLTKAEMEEICNSGIGFLFIALK